MQFMAIQEHYKPISPKKESFAGGLRIFLSHRNRKKALYRYIQPAINKMERNVTNSKKDDGRM
jgi:hypothetical protein